MGKDFALRKALTHHGELLHLTHEQEQEPSSSVIQAC